MVGYVGDAAAGPTEYAAGSTELFNELVDKANAASEDDDQLNWSELEKFLESLVGGDITREQAEKLIKIYGGNGVVSTASIVEVMTKDGFLSPIAGDGSFVMGWTINWDAIDGGLIADAMYREMGLDPAVDRMTAAQFDEATDKLFGDREGVTGDNAVFLARSFGTGELLDRTQIAGMFERDDLHIDGVKGEHYIRLYANYSDTTKAFGSNEEAADYIMQFDDGDGFLTREELQKAIDSRLADGAGTDDDIMNQFMMFYGEKHPQGAMIVTRDGVMAMLNDTSLNLGPRGSDGANGFGINLHITPVDRVINGYSYFNPSSFNDGIVSKEELEAMFTRLGLEVTPEQAQFLINVYGNGTTMLVSDVTRMREDGFMTTGNIMIDPVTLDWNAIDGVLLARAVFWAAGVDPNTPGVTLTPEQFNDAVDTLFGDKTGQSLEDAKKQVKFFGANNVVTVDQMAAVFDNPGFYMDGVKGANNVKIEIKLGDVEMNTVQQQTAYLMSFDEDNNGVLSETELHNAIASDKNDQHTTLNDDMITRLARIYGIKQEDGSYVFDPATLDLMANDGVLVALPNSTGNAQHQGLKISLDFIPDERLIDAMFRWAGKDPATDTLTAAEFDNGTDDIFGDWKPVRESSAKELAAKYGSTGEDGVSVMSRQDLINMFNSGGIRRGGVGDRTFLPIIVGADDAAPPYSVSTWWNTIVEMMGIAGKSFIEALAAATGHTPEEVAKAFNDTGANLQRNGEIVQQVVLAVIDGIKAGAQWAVGVIDMVIGTLLNDPAISAEGKATLEQAYEDAKSGTDSAATAFLMSLVGMSPEEARTLLNNTSGISELNYETLDNTFQFDALWAAAEEEYANDPTAPGHQDGELELTGRSLQEFLSSPEGAQYRKDFALEWNYGAVGDPNEPGVLHTLDGRQVRVFVTMVRTNGDGQKTFDVRFRVMDEVGATGSPTNFMSFDGGFYTSHDIVLRFTGNKPGEEGGWQRTVLYNSSFGFVAETDLNVTQIFQAVAFFAGKGGEVYAAAKEKLLSMLAPGVQVVTDPNAPPPEARLTRVYMNAAFETTTTPPPADAPFLAFDVELPPGETTVDPMYLGITQEEWTSFVDFLKTFVGNKVDFEGGIGIGFSTSIDVTGREWALVPLVAGDGAAYLAGYTWMGGRLGGDVAMSLYDVVLEQIVAESGGDAGLSLDWFFWGAARVSGPVIEYGDDTLGTLQKPRFRGQWNEIHPIGTFGPFNDNPVPQAPPPPA